MIWFKRVTGFVLLLILLAAAALGIYIYRAFPALDGELKATGLQASVSISRDASDVTHIQAQTPHDLWFSLGHVHAQERGWQMEFNRRVMHGELSEVFGAGTLDTDKLLRTLGIMQAAQRQWQALPPEGKDALQAYSDGVNAFYAGASQALSPEFHILGVKPGGASGQPWSPQDAVGWSLMMALDLGGNWGTEFARLTAAKTLDTGKLWQLFPPYPGEQPASKTDLSKLYASLGIYRTAPKVADAGAPVSTLAMASAINEWADGLGLVDGKGSNSWVVDGAHTRSGKPLMANDPHLSLSAPAIWYFANLQAPATGKTTAIDAIGATLPGLPFVVLGRTSKAAWTFTNTAPDVQDLFIEQINPANPQQYRVPTLGGDMRWQDFKTRTETIRVKGEPDVNINVRESRHGPVISDVQKAHGDLLDTKKFVIALQWAALDTENQTVMAGLRANQAQSVAEVLAAFSVYHSPMQNLVTADVDGGMAFKAIGKVPQRRSDNDILGVAPSPGWDARYDWAGWLPYADTPQTDAPAIRAKGWLATANQRITPDGYPFFIGQDWTVPYRQNRIEQLLAATPKHDMASMQKIQADVLSPTTVRLLPFLQKALQTGSGAAVEQARQAMQGFDGVMRADKAAPLIFAAWADEVTRGILGGKLGKELFATLYGKRHFRSTVEDILERNDADWCGSGGCEAQSLAALERSLARLQKEQGKDASQWQWGRAHFALSGHKPFTNVPLLARYFDVKVATGGDTFSINVGQYWSVDGKTSFASRQAASMRALYDFADLENSKFIYQTGQSGLVFSSRYQDMSSSWAAVEYRPLQMKPSVLAHRLTLVP